MRINLTLTSFACSKKGCKFVGPKGLHRHHRGCEAMILRHFQARARTVTYKDFLERYHMYDPEDVVPLCEYHHKAIHNSYVGAYAQVMRMHIGKIKKPLSQWTWKQARIFMVDLRSACDMWLNDPEDGAARFILSKNLLGHPNCTVQSE